jgi:hypothetical protein
MMVKHGRLYVIAKGQANGIVAPLAQQLSWSHFFRNKVISA